MKRTTFIFTSKPNTDFCIKKDNNDDHILSLQEISKQNSDDDWDGWSQRRASELGRYC